jgi:type I restriction enzyme S subunit
LIAKFKLRVRPAGTVIFPKRGGAIATNKKRILLEPAVFDLNTMGLVPSEALVPKFLLYWLETKDLASLADGSNVPQINVPDVAPLEVPVPPPDEQQRVVEELEAQLSTLDASQQAIERAQRRSAALRRSILEHAFAGRLVSREPSDEPASVLLERITAERAAAPKPSRQKRKISA